MFCARLINYVQMFEHKPINMYMVPWIYFLGNSEANSSEFLEKL